MPSYRLNIFKEVESLNLWFKDTVFSGLCSCYPAAALVPLSPSVSTGCCRPYNGPEPRGIRWAAAHSAHARVTEGAHPSLLRGHLFTRKHTHSLSMAILFSLPSQPFSTPEITS